MPIEACKRDNADPPRIYDRRYHRLGVHYLSYVRGALAVARRAANPGLAKRANVQTRLDLGLILIVDISRVTNFKLLPVMQIKHCLNLWKAHYEY